MNNVITISIPLWQLFLMVLLPMSGIVIMLVWLRRIAYKYSAPGEERDWSIPSLAYREGASFLHHWDVRCKIFTIIVYSFAVASLHNLRPALVAVGISLVILVIAKVSFYKVLLRMMAITGFIGMFMIVMPLSVPVHKGDTLLILGGLDWLRFNLRGLHLASTIAAKALAVTLLMEPLLSTAPLPVTLHGLSRLGVPEIVGQMILLSYRYLHVFCNEGRRMSSGMRVRGFSRQTNLETLRATANFLGMLFVRSFERTERVFDAMRARGYNGKFPEAEELHLCPRDIIIAALWIAVGAILIFCDRIVC